jgi:hypothetical protein
MSGYNVTLGYIPTLGVTQQASGIVGSTGPQGPAGPGLGTTSSVNTSGIITASYFVGNGSLLTNLPGSGNSGYANTAGIATYSGTSGIATYSSTAGIATYATRSGIATYASTSGISTYASTAGIATYASTSGISTYASTAGIATYSTTAGIATYSTTAGITTNVIGGIASVTSLSVSGITTLGVVTAVTSINFASGALLGDTFNDGGFGLKSAPNQYVNLASNNLEQYIEFNDYQIVIGAGFTGTENYKYWIFGKDGKLTFPDLTLQTTAFTGYASTAGIATYASSSIDDFTVGQNLYVTGTLSIGGTSVILNTTQLQVKDKDIVVGYTTDANNNDVSNDTTANHGGISIASTVGSPIINIPLQVGVNSNPSTYKQLMWIKAGNYSGLGTDVWLSNYAISIGNTATVQNGSRLTVGTGFTVYNTYLDAQDIRAKNITAGIVTASSFSGNATSATYATTSGVSTIAGYASTSGISTTSQGLTGTPNISVGIITATDYRIQSVAEKTTIVGLNTANLVYNTGGGNVAICTNPSGDITLNVTGIPTDSTFDNYSLAFSVIVTNTGTARSCTAINLNGLSRTIKWFGGSLSAAISGVTTSSGYDVYSFTGINTVGSASTTANYIVLGSVNGSYR